MIQSFNGPTHDSTTTTVCWAGPTLTRDRRRAMPPCQAFFGRKLTKAHPRGTTRRRGAASSFVIHLVESPGARAGCCGLLSRTPQTPVAKPLHGGWCGLAPRAKCRSLGSTDARACPERSRRIDGGLVGLRARVQCRSRASGRGVDRHSVAVNPAAERRATWRRFPPRSGGLLHALVPMLLREDGMFDAPAARRNRWRERLPPGDGTPPSASAASPEPRQGRSSGGAHQPAAGQQFLLDARHLDEADLNARGQRERVHRLAPSRGQTRSPPARDHPSLRRA